MQSFILYDAQLDTAEHNILDDLVTYQFLGLCGSLSKDAENARDPQHPHYYLRDAPLAMRAALQAAGALPKDIPFKDVTHTITTPRSLAVATVVGKFFEDMIRDMVAESSSNDWQVLRGDWREPCTEIDFVAISVAKRTVIWGSDKLSAQKQDPHNLLCHIVSYFNNRLWQNAAYFNYRHVLIFISVQEDNKDRFSNMPGPLNALLQPGRSKELEDLCKQKLSNHEGGGNLFTWYERRKQEDQDTSDKNKNKKKKNSISSAPSTSTTLPPSATTSELPTTTTVSTIPTSVPPTTQKSSRQPDPIDQKAFFVISACYALDLDDLINGVQLDNFVPK
eukprot:Phypoly_transcript_04028.p2 GENE.Phypoly_transcript_04028~~Phypoly_transcript_04028.p2  ORF type:complete len:335 (-),score=51.21 Phypoly_transcript_04028:16-1020(-)